MSLSATFNIHGLFWGHGSRFRKLSMLCLHVRHAVLQLLTRCSSSEPSTYAITVVSVSLRCPFSGALCFPPLSVLDIQGVSTITAKGGAFVFEHAAAFERLVAGNSTRTAVTQLASNVSTNITCCVRVYDLFPAALADSQSSRLLCFSGTDRDVKGPSEPIL
jgi:hypothetical protein